MSHALIIGDNMIVSRAIENRLAPQGFDSVDRAWTARQAADRAEQRRPDLIVVDDSIADGSPIDVARTIAASCGAPVFVVTSGRVRPDEQGQSGSRMRGPFHVVQLEAVLAMVCSSTREMQLCA